MHSVLDTLGLETPIGHKPMNALAEVSKETLSACPLSPGQCLPSHRISLVPPSLRDSPG